MTRVLPLVAVVLACAARAEADEAAYRAEIEAWRAQREARLRGEDGWLTLAGLHWLAEGRQSAGSAEGQALRLPASAPAHALDLELRDGRVTYALAPGVAARSGASSAPPTGELRPDSQGEPTRLSFGPVSLYVIERGDRYAVRVKDSEAATRREFKGLDWYPIDPAWRVEARFVPHAAPVHVRVPNVLGEVSEMKSPGDVVFRAGGRELRLTPVFETDDENELFFIFKDGTSGKDSYPAGRFLYAALPRDGRVTLDFNKAYSPPCAFTPYATCPLPPERNRLTLPVTAGEKHAGAHH